ncbi:S1C family serine protease [Microbacterium sp. KNMS]
MDEQRSEDTPLNIPPRPAPPTGYGRPQEAPAQPTPPHAAPPHAAPGHPGAPYRAQSAYEAQGEGQGAAFGATQPTQPLPHDGPPQAVWAPQPRAEERKSKGGGRVAAAILVAALVGGGAGFGGGWVSNSLTAGGGSVAESGSAPSNITVNNPGSVNEATAVATEVLPSVVTIEVAGGQSSGSGSGVVISEDGYVVTNTHVVTLGGTAADATVRVTASDGRIYDATIVGTDPTYDLAVIKLEGASGLTPIEFADSSKLNVGATTVAVGAPLGLANTVTTGIVSALNRSIEIASAAAPEGDSVEGEDEGQGEGSSPWFFDIPGQEDQQAQASESIAISVIQTDAAINPGNSGGALVDSEGKLIGVNVAIATADQSSSESGSIGVGFAIPSNVVERVANEIIENGTATHGLLGASVQPSSQVEGATITGAYIAEVVEGGAAEAAGLQEGDIVTRFNGAKINDAVDLTAQVRAAAGGSEAEVVYVRDGEEHTATVELGTLE